MQVSIFSTTDMNALLTILVGLHIYTKTVAAFVQLAPRTEPVGRGFDSHTTVHHS